MALPLFGKRPVPLSDDERQAAAVDLERIQGGGIPLGAEQRLKAIAAADSPVFSSDLSAKEYAVAQASGLTPIAQIMGSSVVQHGWQNYGLLLRRRDPGGAVPRAPWNLSRQRSFDRLRQEAQFAGADAVIGIEMAAKGFSTTPGNVEYVVFGTAVRETGVARGGSPETTDVRALRSGCLQAAPHRSRDVGRDRTHLRGQRGAQHAGQSDDGLLVGQPGDDRGHPGVYAARRLAMDEVVRQASAAGANDMVISTLTHTIDHREYESAGFRRHFFIVSMHVLGTAIALGAHEPHPAPLGTPVMSINLGV